MIKKVKICLAAYPGDLVLRPTSAEWMQRTLIKAGASGAPYGGETEGAHFEVWESGHENISEVVYYRRTDTPIDMVRNHSVDVARQFKCDMLLMLDNDMEPDQPGPRAKKFWESSFPWLFDRVANGGEPALIFAPYLHGLRGYNNVCVFDFESQNNNHYPFSLRQYTRNHAAAQASIQRVAAGPTGVMLIDMRVFDDLPTPYFQYEWVDDGDPCPSCRQPKPGKRIAKASTEDCYFTRNVSLAYYDRPQAGCYCNWDAWAVHHKVQAIERPEVVTTEQVGAAFAECEQMKRSAKEGLQDLERDKRLPSPKKRVVIAPEVSPEPPRVVCCDESGMAVCDA